jgi:amino acid adenylation domain-containing protein
VYRTAPYQLQHLLAASAGATPERPAVRYGDEGLCYADLDAGAARVAHALRELGTRPGDRVALFLPKGIPAVVSVFGVLKAGGVYVPVDPHAPARRAALILADCDVRQIVTTRDRLAALAAVAPELTLRAIVLDDPAPPGPGGSAHVVAWRDVMGGPLLVVPHDGVETDLAYILYTSGSTGVPKGVMISHRAALTFIHWTHREFGITADDVVSSHAPLHFDLSIFDLFTTIMAGGTVALVPDRLSTFPVKLTELIRVQGVTVWYSVPSALVLMLTRGKLADDGAPTLRLILFAGEVFPLKYLKELRRAFRGRLVNLYGPTETNVCTWYEVGNDVVARDTPIPIGRVTQNYDVFAWTEDGRVAGSGETGELYARGPGIMAGYWGDAAKTAAVLVPNPRRPAYDERVCRTGDVVTVDPATGDYLYQGRRDHMVKVRGYRVELGEIEAVLYQHEGVREAAVVVPDGGTEDTQLRAFIVTGGTTSVEALERHRFERLPRYMVPATFTLCSALPKTSTGKVDRPALSSRGPAEPTERT